MTPATEVLVQMLYQLQRQLAGRDVILRQTYGGTWVAAFRVADIQTQIDRLVNQ